MSQTKLEYLKEKYEKECFVEENYKKTKDLEDKRFGNVSVWIKKTGDDILVKKEMNAKNKKFLKIMIDQAKDRMSLNHQYIMKMVDFSVHVVQEDDLKIWGFYQAPMQDLKKEIERRKNISK